MIRMKPVTLRKIRQLHDLTQEDVAVLLGVSRGAVQQLEAGRLKLSPRLRRKFIEELSVTPDVIEFVERFN
jgi:transcriptional regulator with XRE-family HTH domain